MAINTRHIGRSYDSLLPSLAAVGAITVVSEQRDPIPPGFYWIDSIDPSWYDDAASVESLREVWLNMVDTLFPGAFVEVRVTHHDARTGLLGGEPVIGKPDRPAHDWTLFQVTKAIPRWPPGTQWGLPFIAPKGGATVQDDVMPEPEYHPFSDADVEIDIPWWGWALGFTVLGAAVYGVVK